MCCSGTLHNWTNLQPQERARATQLGLDVFTRRDGYAGFRQPCTAYEEPECTIYTRRPKACRDYACPLLEQVENEKVSLEEALAKTREVRQLILSLQSKMPRDVRGLPLDSQVRLSWPPAEALPPEVEPIFKQLTALLKETWRVKWRRAVPASKDGKRRRIR